MDISNIISSFRTIALQVHHNVGTKYASELKRAEAAEKARHEKEMQSLLNTEKEKIAVQFLYEGYEYSFDSDAGLSKSKIGSSRWALLWSGAKYADKMNHVFHEAALCLLEIGLSEKIENSNSRSQREAAEGKLKEVVKHFRGGDCCEGRSNKEYFRTLFTKVGRLNYSLLPDSGYGMILWQNKAGEITGLELFLGSVSKRRWAEIKSVEDGAVVSRIGDGIPLLTDAGLESGAIEFDCDNNMYLYGQKIGEYYGFSSRGNQPRRLHDIRSGELIGYYNHSLLTDYIYSLDFELKETTMIFVDSRNKKYFLSPSGKTIDRISYYCTEDEAYERGLIDESILFNPNIAEIFEHHGNFKFGLIVDVNENPLAISGEVVDVVYDNDNDDKIVYIDDFSEDAEAILMEKYKEECHEEIKKIEDRLSTLDVDVDEDSVGTDEYSTNEPVSTEEGAVDEDY
jgi:hypothetical protein